MRCSSPLASRQCLSLLNTSAAVFMVEYGLISGECSNILKNMGRRRSILASLAALLSARIPLIYYSSAQSFDKSIDDVPSQKQPSSGPESPRLCTADP